MTMPSDTPPVSHEAIVSRRAAIRASRWTLGEGYEQEDPGFYIARDGGGIVWSDDTHPTRSEVDFIAHAPGDIDALLSENARLRALLREGDRAALEHAEREASKARSEGAAKALSAWEACVKVAQEVADASRATMNTTNDPEARKMLDARRAGAAHVVLRMMAVKPREG